MLTGEAGAVLSSKMAYNTTLTIGQPTELWNRTGRQGEHIE